MNIGIYIYDQAEVLDFSGPFEVFSTAARVNGNGDLFKVFLIGETGATVTARAGYRVIPDYSIANHPALDVLLIAGGVHTGELQKNNVIAWVTQQVNSVSIVASVCTGVFLLAKAGVLNSAQVTTHWEDIPDLKNMFPELNVIENTRWVECGNIFTSGGISAGIDMSLQLVSKLHSLALANKTALQMEYRWQMQ